jgi:hypothetical protein
MRRTLMLLSTMVLAILLAGGLALVAVSPAARADGDCQPSGSEVVCTFNFTGAAQSWTVPEEITQATFDVYGAQGGSSSSELGVSAGGLGGKASAIIAVTPGDTLQVNVGGRGGDGAGSVGGDGGFNGGAAGGNGCCSGPGGGGGASDVRRDTDASGDFALAERIIVAGGGGGAGGFTGGAGGAGGGLSGDPAGDTPSNDHAGGGGGGTSSTGGLGGDPGVISGVGVFGTDGGDGGSGLGGRGGDGVASGDGGGGGGGGLKGGGGGGGSGFGPSGVVFSDGGVRSGNGLVTITYTPTDTTPTDKTPPRVIGTFPRGGGEVGPAASIRVTFSEEMQEASVINAFKLFKKGSTNQIAAAVTYNAATDIATLNPTNNLRRGATYKAVVTTVAKDMAGNRLDQNNSTTGLQQKVWFFEID